MLGPSCRGAIAVLFVVLPLTACAAEPPGLTDADVVFCLSDGQRAALADAAVTLNLAKPAPATEDVIVDSRPVTVRQWRADQPDAFTKACSAIRPARSAAAAIPPAIQSWLLATVNVVVGAVMGFGSANLLQRSARARQNGRLLRSSATAFLAAANAYARDWGDKTRPEQPSDLPVQDRRAELMSELRMIQSEYPESSARAAVDRLSTSLSEEVFRRWPAQDHDRVAAELQALEKSVIELSSAVEHPRRHRDKLRGKATGAPGQSP
jgi:hypothetical protein